MKTSEFGFISQNFDYLAISVNFLPFSEDMPVGPLRGPGFIVVLDEVSHEFQGGRINRAHVIEAKGGKGVTKFWFHHQNLGFELEPRLLKRLYTSSYLFRLVNKAICYIYM